MPKRLINIHFNAIIEFKILVWLLQIYIKLCRFNYINQFRYSVLNKSKNEEEKLFPIGMVAKLFSISVATLRLYEAEGLIIPRKSKGKHRLYSESDLKRIECIRDMIEQKGLNLAGIRMMLSTIPCWELKPCSIEDRENCDAYYTTSVPCWMVENKGEKCKNEDCRLCSVYIKSAACNNIKVILKEFWRTETDV